MHLIRRAFSRAALRAGSSKPARIAIMAITTRSSISVNAPAELLDADLFMPRLSPIFTATGDTHYAIIHDESQDPCLVVKSVCSA
jgi:hypothetical protein